MKIYIYPTDTLWGIGCNIYSEESVKKIAEIKKSASDKPQSILFCDIRKVMDFFSFPSEMSEQWLRRFFELESTMLIPIHHANYDIPSWVICGSKYVGVRCISNTATRKIIYDEGSPIITTSLNLSGQIPIVEKSEAKGFVKKHYPAGIFCDSDVHVSGHSSSIVQIDNMIKFVRRGCFDQEIEQHLGLLSA